MQVCTSLQTDNHASSHHSVYNQILKNNSCYCYTPTFGLTRSRNESECLVNNSKVLSYYNMSVLSLLHQVMLPAFAAEHQHANSTVPAATDRYLLPTKHSVANPMAVVAAIERWDRRRTDGVDA